MNKRLTREMKGFGVENDHRNRPAETESFDLVKTVSAHLFVTTAYETKKDGIQLEGLICNDR